MYIKGKNKHKLFVWLLGGPVWPLNSQIEPILLPSYPLTYINIHVNYSFVCDRVHAEVSADAAAMA